MCIMQQNDSHFWVKLFGKHFDLKTDLLICVCYIIPSNSSRNVLVENSIFDDILDNIANFQSTYGEDKYSFMILGDFNSRTGNLHDFVEDDNVELLNLNILPDDYIADRFLTRYNKDLNVNSNGRLLIDFLK